MAVRLRTKVFLTTALTIGLLLIVVGLTTLKSLKHQEVNKLDTRLCLEARRVARLGFEPMPPRFEADLQTKLRLQSDQQLLYRSLTPDKEIRYESALASLLPSNLAWTQSPKFTGKQNGPACFLATWYQDGDEWRAARVAFPVGVGIIASNTQAIQEDILSTLRTSLPLVAMIALILTGLSAWMISIITTRPLLRLRAAMRQLDRHHFNTPLPLNGDSVEFDELVSTYNHMLARLHASFHQASRFSADAAHELRTPLTVIQGKLEQAIRHSEGRAIQEELTSTQEQVSQLVGITRKLLILSQADAGKLPLHLTHINLSQVMQELVTDMSMLTSSHRIESDLESGCYIKADSLLLQQALNNLVSNAVRHSQMKGWIRVALKSRNGWIEVSISNQCEPISLEQRSRIFERFFRTQTAMDRGIEGSGLGLSLSREIARAHGGDLVLAPTDLDVVSFVMRMPT